jgi:hypothetical protein
VPSEQEDAGIERGPAEHRDRGIVVAPARDHLGRHPSERFDAPRRQDCSADARDGRHQKAFGEQLLNQAAPARSDREPDGHLAAPQPRAREQQARDVDAGDDEHARRRREQHEGGSTDRGVHPRVADRDRRRAPHRARWRHVVSELRSDRRELGVRLFDGHAVLQARDDADEVLRRGEVLGVGEARGHRRWNPELRLAAESREAVRQDADDGQRHVIDGHRLADDRGIGREAAAPEPRAEDRDRRGVDGVFLGAERAAGERRDAERAKVLGRDDLAVKMLGIALAARRDQRRGERRDVIERARRGLQRLDVRPRPAKPRPAVTRRDLGVEEDDETIRIGERQRPQQRAVDDAEHRRGRADAEGERRDRDQRDPAHPDEAAQRVAEIVSERVHHQKSGRGRTTGC